MQTESSVLQELWLLVPLLVEIGERFFGWWSVTSGRGRLLIIVANLLGSALALFLPFLISS